MSDEARVAALIVERDSARLAAEALAVWVGPADRARVLAAALAYADESTGREIASALDGADRRLLEALEEIRREGG